MHRVPLKTKTGSEVGKVFDSIMNKNHPKKLWVDQGSKFYNKTFDKLLKSKNKNTIRSLFIDKNTLRIIKTLF